jgi:hypothetical protein
MTNPGVDFRQKLLGLERQSGGWQGAETRDQASVPTAQQQIIDQADIGAGLRAAAAIGDDRLQRISRGYVSPESFTHGSSGRAGVLVPQLSCATYFWSPKVTLDSAPKRL